MCECACSFTLYAASYCSLQNRSLLQRVPRDGTSDHNLAADFPHAGLKILQTSTSYESDSSSHVNKLRSILVHEFDEMAQLLSIHDTPELIERTLFPRNFLGRNSEHCSQQRTLSVKTEISDDQMTFCARSGPAVTALSGVRSKSRSNFVQQGC